MDKAFQSFWVGILWIPALFLPLAGCKTLSQPDSKTTPETAAEIQPSPHQRIGTITEVQLEPALAVIRQSILSPPLNADLYISRAPGFQPTAVLQRSPYQFGDHVGFYILAGEPAPGDEVIQPGNEEYQELLAPYE